MAEGRRVWYLILIMVAVTVVEAGVIVTMLYRTAIDGQRERLLETARSQARLMEAMARHDAVFERATPGGPEAATLSQIIDAHDNYVGFGETGEFTLARLEDDNIIFLLSHRHEDVAVPSPARLPPRWCDRPSTTAPTPASTSRSTSRRYCGSSTKSRPRRRPPARHRSHFAADVSDG